VAQPKILIIDDDRDLQKMLAEAFKQDGFTVLQEYGGARGLNTAERENPDVVLLDVMTPELRGSDVLRELRRRRVRTRVVVFTGSVRSVEQIVELVRQGACDYLEKTGDIEAGPPTAGVSRQDLFAEKNQRMHTATD
jgi:two-component system response regulator PfeR